MVFYTECCNLLITVKLWLTLRDKGSESRVSLSVLLYIFLFFHLLRKLFYSNVWSVFCNTFRPEKKTRLTDQPIATLFFSSLASMLQNYRWYLFIIAFENFRLAHIAHAWTFLTWCSWVILWILFSIAHSTYSSVRHTTISTFFPQVKHVLKTTKKITRASELHQGTPYTNKNLI